MDDLKAGLPIVLFETRRQFADWLVGQPRDAKGAWLRFAKQGTGRSTLGKAEAIELALCHGWIDGQLDKFDETSWLIRFTPRKPHSKWSLVNRNRALELIAEGQMTAQGMAEIKAAQSDGRWEAAYAPASKAEVPADLQEALSHSAAAAALFATLTGANRYAILYRIRS
jgi:uncharacterized protein YdeI (YjbR/CyaY-like superfamily)